MINFLILLVVLYVGAGIVFGILDAKKADKEIAWTSKDTWIGFLSWPKRFIK
jgi:hypothetical protein